ncbi:MAG: hypothetical protein RI973_583 [Bacteroidota bacterium]|jgi:hypothetical protein
MQKRGLLLGFSLFFSLCAIAQTERLPGIGIYVPDAYGKGYVGNVSFGSTLQSRSRLSGDFFNPDGNASVNLGLGNPEKLVGLDVRVNLYGFFNAIGSPGNFGEGSLDISLSRRVADNWWLCAGINDLTGWKLAPAHQIRSFFTTATGVLKLREHAEDASPAFSKLYLTAGLGNGRFRLDEDYSIEDEGPLNLIAAAAVQVGRETNIFAEWNGYTTVAGFSSYPFRRLPIQILVGVDDIFHEKWKFIFACGAGINLQRGGDNNSLRRMIYATPPPPQTSRVNR